MAISAAHPLLCGCSRYCHHQNKLIKIQKIDDMVAVTGEEYLHCRGCVAYFLKTQTVFIGQAWPVKKVSLMAKLPVYDWDGIIFAIFIGLEKTDKRSLRTLVTCHNLFLSEFGSFLEISCLVKFSDKVPLTSSGPLDSVPGGMFWCLGVFMAADFVGPLTISFQSLV